MSAMASDPKRRDRFARWCLEVPHELDQRLEAYNKSHYQNYTATIRLAVVEFLERNES